MPAELRRWFWDGDCRDTMGATVKSADGTPHKPYSVFVPRDGSAVGVAIANFDPARGVSVSVAIPGQSMDVYRYRLIDDAEWKPAAAGITIPARSAAVVIPVI